MTGRLGFTTSISVKLPTRVTGVKSFTGSKLTFFIRNGGVESGELVAISSVWPSKRRARDVKRGTRSVRTRPILDDDAFLKCDTERLGDNAAIRIAGAAGAEHGNEGHGLAGIVLARSAELRQCSNIRHPQHRLR